MCSNENIIERFGYDQMVFGGIFGGGLAALASYDCFTEGPSKLLVLVAFAAAVSLLVAFGIDLFKQRLGEPSFFEKLVTRTGAFVLLGLAIVSPVAAYRLGELHDGMKVIPAMRLFQLRRYDTNANKVLELSAEIEPALQSPALPAGDRMVLAYLTHNYENGRVTTAVNGRILGVTSENLSSHMARYTDTAKNWKVFL